MWSQGVLQFCLVYENMLETINMSADKDKTLYPLARSSPPPRNAAPYSRSLSDSRPRTRGLLLLHFDMGRRRPRAAQPALVAHCPQSRAANALETLPITSSLVERQMSILAGAFESRAGDLIGELLCECCSLHVQSMSERQTSLTGDQRAERAKSSNPSTG
jgi:hypothetical protein